MMPGARGARAADGETPQTAARRDAPARRLAGPAEEHAARGGFRAACSGAVPPRECPPSVPANLRAAADESARRRHQRLCGMPRACAPPLTRRGLGQVGQVAAGDRRAYVFRVPLVLCTTGGYAARTGRMRTRARPAGVSV